MTPDQLKDARATLGQAWGRGRPLTAADLGRILRLGSKDPGESIRDYEAARTAIPGPVAVAVEMMLAGAQPPDELSNAA